MTLAWVGLGANLGDANATLEAALRELAALSHTTLKQRSSLYRSAPVDAVGPDFINAVAVLESALEAQTLLMHLQTIESHHGRVRAHRNAPRTLDLDLLLFGDAIIATPELTVPHPRMAARAFVLAPLLEVSPDIVIPGQGPAASLLARLAAQPIVRLGGPTS
ncbi:MAG: 2-amino-4-hydroxy-6-hydroxymethyldihydropteridine diphosphokinase [Burkholderiales bacterium]